MPRPEPPPSQMNDTAIRARVAAEFAPAQVQAVLAELERYQGDSPAGRARIHHAVLTLAAGNSEQLRYFVGCACVDFRDVIFWAYHPEEAQITREQARALLDRLRKAGFPNIPDLPKDG